MQKLTHAKGNDFIMDSLQSDQTKRRQMVESLAHEFKVSTDRVAQLYDSELHRLEFGARIKSFLHIFTYRNVREVLRQRSTEA